MTPQSRFLMLTWTWRIWWTPACQEARYTVQLRASNPHSLSLQDCPTLQQAVDFLQTELGANLDDQTVQTIFNCAEDVLAQLGFN